MDEDNKEKEIITEYMSLILDKEKFLNRMIEIHSEINEYTFDSISHGETALRRTLTKVLEPLEDLIAFTEDCIEMDNHVCEECAGELSMPKDTTEKKLN